MGYLNESKRLMPTFANQNITYNNENNKIIFNCRSYICI
jgi:hypothetical protein